MNAQLNENNPHDTLDEITRIVHHRDKCFETALAVQNLNNKAKQYKPMWTQCLHEARYDIGSATNTILRYVRNYVAGEVFCTIYDGQTKYAYQLFRTRLRNTLKVDDK
jgi:hypothetical protein